MNINVTDLDSAYTKCESLNTLSKTDGGKLLTNLETDITNLKNHWKGSDAKEHINNLIKVYNGLVAIITDAKAITSRAGGSIISIHTARRSNGGSGNVGADLDGQAPQSSSIAEVQETNEYFCDPAAKTDYSLLEQICTDFDTFKTSFKTTKEELMSMWLAGADRETAVTKFSEFDENTTVYKTLLDSAKSDLNTAVSNLSQL